MAPNAEVPTCFSSYSPSPSSRSSCSKDGSEPPFVQGDVARWRSKTSLYQKILMGSGLPKPREKLDPGKLYCCTFHSLFLPLWSPAKLTRSCGLWALQVLSGLGTAGAQAELRAPHCSTEPGHGGALGVLGLQADEGQAELDFWVCCGSWDLRQAAIQQEPVSCWCCQDPGVNSYSMRRPELASSQFPGVQGKKRSEK